ncbi:uncharacterized protein AMSG_12394 [Thecamonas trahens ATCC 50062]|uniref:Uncharacterized protein n=1 Tax=Thecamonas trahens ATCC 50062 TaxID=461836 RepID=A0A0L0DS98_THETB|nr:hypothetical protein AMSG_12394 [Thecamonas trahens ATCC 50062]KNC55214.1 hypothetical protein AMSG_12394 [Thecamonas trahens ATCC 50062]|eukprot:XP_013753192.1 hypothetical protein AMSG_12394 [Thecamonas trahens ATCC 50062]
MTEAYFLESVVVVDDADDDFAYEAVDVIDSDDDALLHDEDLAAATRAAQNGYRSTAPSVRQSPTDHATADQAQAVAGAALTRKPEVIDDFICNFLNRMGMRRTLEVFQTEWYELESKGLIDRAAIGAVPDVYSANVELDQERKALTAQVAKEQKETQMTRATWEKLTQERNHHRMHHRRVEQEKQLLIKQLKQMRKLQLEYEPTLEQLKAKHQAALQEKDRKGRIIMRLKEQLERTKAALAQMKEAAERAGQPLPDAVLDADQDRATRRKPRSARAVRTSSAKARSSTPRRPAGSGYAISGGAGPLVNDRDLFALPELGNPHVGKSYEQAGPAGFSSAASLPAHEDSIAGLAMHPSHPVAAAVSDDGKWSLWTLETNELIMSGAGHAAWVGACAFSPRGSHLATGSGDTTIKLWDVLHYQCTSTLADHTQAVWGVDFHCSGDALVSCSLDGTTRLWDLARSLAVATLRGHVNSVNSVKFEPYASALATGSADHTVSLWDPRTHLCTHTFFGHETSVARVAYSRDGTKLASADSDGMVKVWDTRAQAELHSVLTCSPDTPYAANDLVFDASGNTLAIATEDGFVRIFDMAQAALVDALQHDDAVNAVAFDADNKTMVSAGADAALHVWSF